MKVALCLATFFLAATTVYADVNGLKYTAEKQERFSNSTDPSVGPITIDSFEELIWMRCTVGQEFDSGKNECVGNPTVLRFTDAATFAKKIGKGWRLPTISEVQSASGHVMRALANGDWEKAGKYGGGGWACEKKSIWTSTIGGAGENGILMADCVGFSKGNAIRGGAVDKFSNAGASLMLVKSAKNNKK